MYLARETLTGGKSNHLTCPPKNSFSLSGTNFFRAALNFSVIIFHSLLYWGALGGTSYDDSIKVSHA
jgi:hypothetical protein